MLVRGIALAVVALLALVGARDPSTSLAGCNPQRPDDNLTYQAGWYRAPGTTVGGAYSAILNYRPYVKPNDPATIAWVNVQQWPNTGQWAQVGWMEEPDGDRFVFVQWTVAPWSWVSSRLFAQSSSDFDILTNYTVLYNNEPGKFTFYYKGVRLPVNDAKAKWVPNASFVAGETKTLASQMPGATYNDMWMADTHIWYSGGWHEFNGFTYDWDAPPPWGDQFDHTFLNPATTIGIHDKRC